MGTRWKYERTGGPAGRGAAGPAAKAPAGSARTGSPAGATPHAASRAATNSAAASWPVVAVSRPSSASADKKRIQTPASAAVMESKPARHGAGTGFGCSTSTSWREGSSGRGAVAGAWAEQETASQTIAIRATRGCVRMRSPSPKRLISYARSDSDVFGDRGNRAVVGRLDIQGENGYRQTVIGRGRTPATTDGLTRRAVATAAFAAGTSG